jgi:Rrf2 family protein
MLSLTCKASIKAVIYLGSKSDTGEKLSIKDVAKCINENEHTVGKLLQKLVREKIINSTKGPNGGFYISAQQQKKSVIEIVHAIDGKNVFKQCGLGLSKCSESNPCPFHNDFKPIRQQFEKMCLDTKVDTLYQNLNSGLSRLVG